MARDYDLTVSHAQLDPIFASLTNDENLIETHSQLYRLPDKSRRQLDQEIRDAEESSARARDCFQSLISKHCPDLDPTQAWEVFEQNFLVPMVHDLGANTYNLIDGKQLPITANHVERFTQPFDSRHHQSLYNVAVSFLDPKEPDVKNYVARLLHAYFCVESIGLSPSVLSRLSSATARPLSLRLFVDTNCLFSILDLHEHPSNFSTKELNDILATSETNSRADFLVTTETIEEAKIALDHAKHQVSRCPKDDNFIRAALSSPMSGLSKRYLIEFQAKGNMLTPDQWFDPYFNNLITFADEAGVSFYDKKSDDLSMRQDVVDDINQVLEYEHAHLPEFKRKSYEKLAHDMKLWHLVRDQRPLGVESPTDARDWLLTLDTRLVGFDRFKLNTRSEFMPICLHPASLIHLLRFWVPRSEKFDEAVLGGLRLPFLFEELDTRAERLSLDIIQRLSDFEGSEHFSDSTVIKVVTNEVLRARISDTHPDEEEVRIVRDAYIAEMTEEMKGEKETNERLSNEIEASRVQLEESRNLSLAREAEIDALRIRLQDEESRLESSSATLSQTEANASRLASRADIAERRLSVTVYGTSVVFLVALSVVSGLLLSEVITAHTELTRTPTGLGLVRGAGSLICFLVFHWLLELFVERRKSSRISSSRAIGAVRKRILTTIMAVISSVIGSWIWNSL